MVKISKIISGHPIRPIVAGEPAFIQKATDLMRTSQVVEVSQISAGEIRFETQNNKYVLRTVPVKEADKVS